MTEKIRLDMKGLNYVALARIIALCTVVVAGAPVKIILRFYRNFVENDESSIVGSVFSLIINFTSAFAGIAIIVLILLGLSKLVIYSETFKKSRTFYIVNLVAAVIFTIIVFLLFIGSILYSYMEPSEDSLKELIESICVFIVIYIPIATFFQIMHVRNLCKGCQELSLAAGEIRLNNLFIGIEKAYRICMAIYAIVGTIALVVIAAAFLKILDRVDFSLEAFNSLRNISDGAVFAILIAALIIFALSIMAFAINLILTIRLWKGQKLLDGREVYVGRDNDNRLILIPNQNAHSNAESINN